MKLAPRNYDYPVDEWNIVENEFLADKNYHHETVFAVGNGYIGMRGNFEEGYAGPESTSLLGTYLNGFYESKPIQYGEIAYGFAKNKQTMLNVTDSKIIKIIIDNEEFNLFSGKLLKYSRKLDMRQGILTRDVIWETSLGKQINLSFERLIPLSHKNLAIIRLQLTPLNFSGEIKIVSAINGGVTNQVAKDDPRVGSAFSGQVLKVLEKHEDDILALTQETSTTKFQLVCGMLNEISTEEYEIAVAHPEQQLEEAFNIDAKQQQTITLIKYISYYSSRDYAADELLNLCTKTLQEAQQHGFEYFLKEQEEYLNDFWQHSDVEIDGDPALQQAMRFNQLQLLMSVAKDGKTNIASKGVTGEGYEGHYFWDSENYVLPFFLYTKPDIARKLLEYRYSTLDKARERAREMSHSKGALYPWRTINGEECSAYFPAGTAQYHINADIILALKSYMEATNDMDFLLNGGAEMIFETARLWEDLGCYVANKNNKFCINCVTGPDEYTAIVDNNFYTNMMAQMNLQYGYDIAKLLKEQHPDQYKKLQQKIKLDDNEITAWQKAAAKMYFPYDDKLQINAQDDTFLSKKPWDFANTPKDKYPLLLHFHPLVIYRHQVLKQADVLLADFWFGNRFSLDQKKRDFDYYEPLTTHDSSLSMFNHSIMASEIGYDQKAYDYFIQTARLDLDNLHGNSQDGIHTANMAGTWMCMAYGFAGMRTYDGKLSFNPKLPKAWNGYSLKINFQDRLIQIEVSKTAVNYKLLQGEPIEFNHQDETLILSGTRRICV